MPSALPIRFSFPRILIPVIITFLAFSSFCTFAQEKKTVEVLYAGSLESNKRIAENAQRLIDSVYIRHQDILMWCDSAYTYTGTNRVDAFGHVHINQNDTLHLYANTIYYDGDKNFARAWGDVKLENKSTTIFTDTLDYDLANNICYYDDNGKIIDSTTTITSKIGKYFTKNDLFFLYIDVEGVNKNFTLKSDTVSYNTKTGRINIYGPTTVQDTANMLYAENGWYDSNSGEAELQQNPVMSNKNQQVSAKYIKYNKATKSGKATGGVRVRDNENSSVITGNYAIYNDEKQTAMVTDSAVYMNYNENDTLYLHADTLRTYPDTVPDEKIVLAYHKVRFFRTDLQGVCDSMVYFTRDSVIQLHRAPVIWSDVHQLTADMVEMQQFTDAPDELRLTGNCFIISEQDSNRFDQIKGKTMIGYIINNKLDHINVNGNGQTLYYVPDKNEIVGLNRAESSKITIKFKEGKVNRISLIKSPEGELKPIGKLNEEEVKLKGFDWKVDFRPQSKNDIFGLSNKLKTENTAREKSAGQQKQEIHTPEEKQKQ